MCHMHLTKEKHNLWQVKTTKVSDFHLRWFVCVVFLWGCYFSLQPQHVWKFQQSATNSLAHSIFSNKVVFIFHFNSMNAEPWNCRGDFSKQLFSWLEELKTLSGFLHLCTNSSEKYFIQHCCIPLAVYWNQSCGGVSNAENTELELRNTVHQLEYMRWKFLKFKSIIEEICLETQVIVLQVEPVGWLFSSSPNFLTHFLRRYQDTSRPTTVSCFVGRESWLFFGIFHGSR